VDAYIAKSADFAKPILRYVREAVHSASSDIEETLKWGAPCYTHDGIICMTAAFKKHCRVIFWKGRLVLGDAARDSGQAQFGLVRSVADLPAKRVLVRYVRKAMALNTAGVKTRRPTPRAAKRLVVPPELAAALKKNKAAQATFDAFSPSHKREYAEWIADAKGEDTRVRRTKTAIEWMAGGKSRNWKYERK
jgi:uncharacterized protein YdeI (YjbR/CyaY-like superfamily)